MVHDTGIVDYRQVCERLAQRLAERGQVIITGVAVRRLVEGTDGVRVAGDGVELHAQVVVNCTIPLIRQVIQWMQLCTGSRR